MKGIIRTIRGAGDVRYRPGDEEKLEKDLTAAELNRLFSRGAITGGFTGGKKTGSRTAESTSVFPEDFPGFDVLGQVEGMTPEKITQMSDEDLLEIKGIGKQTLAAIRSYGK